MTHLTRDSNNFETPVRIENFPERRVTTRHASQAPRLALSLDEAAEALGVSRDYLDEHIRGELRVVRRGRRVLVSVKELERWLERSASVVLE
jgi:excisionase family DNA binding protein